MMFRADYGGCVRIYTCKSMERRGHQVLFVCPTSNLEGRYNKQCCTLNKIFGLGPTKGSTMATFDDRGYDAIVLGEILL